MNCSLSVMLSHNTNIIILMPLNIKYEIYSKFLYHSDDVIVFREDVDEGRFVKCRSQIVSQCKIYKSLTEIMNDYDSYTLAFLKHDTKIGNLLINYPFQQIRNDLYYTVNSKEINLESIDMFIEDWYTLFNL